MPLRCRDRCTDRGSRATGDSKTPEGRAARGCGLHQQRCFGDRGVTDSMRSDAALERRSGSQLRDHVVKAIPGEPVRSQCSPAIDPNEERPALRTPNLNPSIEHDLERSCSRRSNAECPKTRSIPGVVPDRTGVERLPDLVAPSVSRTSRRSLALQPATNT